MADTADAVAATDIVMEDATTTKPAAAAEHEVKTPEVSESTAGGAAATPIPAAATTAGTAEAKVDNDAALPLATSEPSGQVRIRASKLGPGEVEVPPTTLMAQFKSTVSRFGPHFALLWKTNPDDTQWKSLTWSGYYKEVISFAKSLLAVGLQPFESVNIIGFNHPRWVIADVGCIAAGGLAAGIYTTNGPDACKYVTEHSDCRVVVVEDGVQLKKFAAVIDQLPRVNSLVLYKEGCTADPALVQEIRTKAPGVTVYTWEEFMALGSTVADSLVDERISAQKPGNCCTLIYTSGTTGPPKGVMISHDNATWTAGRTIAAYNVNVSDRLVSYLPLSHIAAQLLDIHAGIGSGCAVYFAAPDALKGALTKWLREVQPTVFFAVPRVWEKIRERIMAAGRESKGLKKSISSWAKAKGTARANNMQHGGPGSNPGCFGCANKLVFSKVRALLGLQQCRIHATGAAPIARETLEFFASLNVYILEVFGQSECTGPHSVSLPSASGTYAWKIGSCGRPLPGTYTRIDPSNQELTYAGRHIMMGYTKMPVETKKTIDEEGYLHSGDMGRLDADDFLYIIGRIKELLITDGGENIPPILIEQAMKEQMNAISNVVLIGDRRKYLTLLITLKTEISEDMSPTDRLAADALAEGARIGSSAKTVAEVIADPVWNKYFTEGITAVNKTATSNAQTVKKFRVLPLDFTIPTGEMTPTMKIKRNVIDAKYKDVIEAMYAEAAPGTD